MNTRDWGLMQCTGAPFNERGLMQCTGAPFNERGFSAMHGGSVQCMRAQFKVVLIHRGLNTWWAQCTGFHFF